MVLQAWTLFVKGSATTDARLAVQHMEAGLQLARRHGLDTTVVLMLANLAELLIVSGEPHRAQDLTAEGIRLASTLGADEELAWLHGLRGYVRLLLGHTAEAEQFTRAALHRAVRMALPVGGLQNLAFLAAAVAEDHPLEAARFLGIVESGRSGVEPPVQRQARERFLADLSARLGDTYGPTYDLGRQIVVDRGALGALSAVLDALPDASRHDLDVG